MVDRRVTWEEVTSRGEKGCCRGDEVKDVERSRWTRRKARLSRPSPDKQRTFPERDVTVEEERAERDAARRALEMEEGRGREPATPGSFEKPEKARRRVLPWRLRKGYGHGDTSIFAYDAHVGRAPYGTVTGSDPSALRQAARWAVIRDGGRGSKCASPTPARPEIKGAAPFPAQNVQSQRRKPFRFLPTPRAPRRLGIFLPAPPTPFLLPPMF